MPRVLALLIASLFPALVFCAGPPVQAPTYRFENGLWFDGQRFVKRTVYASQRELQFTRPASSSAAANTVVDLAGAYVIPPL